MAGGPKSAPVLLGDALREVDPDERPTATAPEGASLCETCFHHRVCAAAEQTQRIGALVSVCPHHFPVPTAEDP